MRVECEIEETYLENDHRRQLPGIVVTCTRCDHKSESFGKTEKSVKRCLFLLREECPESEENFYFVENPD